VALLDEVLLLNEDSPSGGRGPTSIKPPTIKPPTAQEDEWGETTLMSAPARSMPVSAPPPQMSAAPYQPVAAAPPRSQTVLLLGILCVLLFGLLIIVLGVVVYLWLR
jgi:hypothetical protein